MIVAAAYYKDNKIYTGINYNDELDNKLEKLARSL
jgi:hypothetical protein